MYPPYKLITWLDLVTKVSIISTVTSFVSTLCTMNVKCMQKGIQVNVMRISTKKERTRMTSHLEMQQYHEEGGN